MVYRKPLASKQVAMFHTQPQAEGGANRLAPPVNVGTCWLVNVYNHLGAKYQTLGEIWLPSGTK